MHKARAFFFVCAGILCLALAYHLGAQSATAQAPGNPVVAIFSGYDRPYVVTANGDIYRNATGNLCEAWAWSLCANVFGGAPTPATQETWGGVKARYRQEGTAKQAQDK